MSTTSQRDSGGKFSSKSSKQGMVKIKYGEIGGETLIQLPYWTALTSFGKLPSSEWTIFFSTLLFILRFFVRLFLVRLQFLQESLEKHGASPWHMLVSNVAKRFYIADKKNTQAGSRIVHEMRFECMLS